MINRDRTVLTRAIMMMIICWLILHCICVGNYFMYDLPVNLVDI